MAPRDGCRFFRKERAGKQGTGSHLRADSNVSSLWRG